MHCQAARDSCCLIAGISANLHQHQQGRHDTMNRFRGFLYKLAKYLGDAQAATSKRKGSITRRAGRRIAGKGTGRLLGKLFR